MDVVQPELFLGFPMDQSIQEAIQAANPHLIQLFLSSSRELESQYLHRLEHQEGSYIGKFVGELLDFADFDLISANIYSITKRMVNSFDPAKYPLRLFATQPVLDHVCTG
jgi:hypothetical protein